MALLRKSDQIAFIEIIPSNIKNYEIIVKFELYR